MRDIRLSRWGAALLVLAQGVPLADAAETRARARERPAPATVVENRFPSSIIYDTGVNAGFPPDVGLTAVGNRFNTIVGYGLPMSNLVSRVTLFPQNDGVQSFTFWAPPNSMNTAMMLSAGVVAADLMGGMFNQVVISPAAHVGPDFVITFIGAFNGPPGLVGLDANGTAMAQGLHGIQGVYSMGNLTMVQGIPGRNAMLRVTGEFYLPVELIDFQIR